LSTFPDNNSASSLAVSNRAPRVGKISEVSSIVKMAPSTIRAKMRAGQFPPNIRLSYKLAVWNLDDVEAWFQAELASAPVYRPHVRAGGGQWLSKRTKESNRAAFNRA
jgi:predicted DNA-binding transcriptional regulator AlpA